MADPDPFPSSYPFFAPSSWSSILPKTRHDIVEAPKDKCGQATNQQNNQTITKMPDGNKASQALQTRSRDRRAVHDI
jgi:hypothetical protein